MNITVTDAGKSPEHPHRSRKRPWWAVGGGLLAIVVIVGAIIVVPRVLHAQRVATYTELVTQTNLALNETRNITVQTDLVTVLYALQFEEATELQSVLGELADLTDHYFSGDNLEALAQANDKLIETTKANGLSEAENELVSLANDEIQTRGYFWQTDFLNLTTDAVEDLLEQPAVNLIVPVADEDVTDEVVEEAREKLQTAETERIRAESQLAAAEARAAALIGAVTGALEPLKSSALGTPERVEFVLGIYPNAAAEMVTMLHDTSKLSVESVSASTFTFNDDNEPIPLSDEATADQVTVTATDAWRAVIIAAHLKEYSQAVTGAWITDAGGIEEAFGFNPFLPVVPF